MIDIMLDLETMGNTPNAAIIAIGAVQFNAECIVDAFYTVVSLQSSADLGMAIDPKTVEWWMKQSDDARGEFTRGQNNCVHIKTALKMFANWLPQTQFCLWGNGAAFDNVILANAYRLAQIRQPWSYRNDRCYRTVAAMNPHITKPKIGTAHNALDDALSQAQHLQAIWAEYIPEI